MKTLKISFILFLTVLLQINSYSQEFITRKSGFDKGLVTNGLIKQPGNPQIETFRYSEGKDKYEIQTEIQLYKDKAGATYDVTTIRVSKNGKLESSESIVENSSGSIILTTQPQSTIAKSGNCNFEVCISSLVSTSKSCKECKSCAQKAKASSSNKTKRRLYFLSNCLGKCISCGVNIASAVACLLNCA